VESLSSDEEHGRVLSVVAAKTGVAETTAPRALDSAAKIASARVLEQMTNMDLKSAGLQAAFFEATDSISSDEEHGQVLSSLMKKCELPTEVVVDIIQSAEHISRMRLRRAS